MKKKIYWLLAIIGVAAIGIAIGVAVFIGGNKNEIKKYSETIFELPENYDTLEREQQDAAYLFNPDDKAKMSGYSNYTVIAYVDSLKGTSYADVRMVDGELRGTPLTNYEIRIAKNIKGTLRTDELIPIHEYGGVSIDGKSFVYVTELPEAGKSYVMYLAAGADGTIHVNKTYLIDGADSFEALKETVNSETDIFDDFIKAAENEDTEFAYLAQNRTSYEQ